MLHSNNQTLTLDACTACQYSVSRANAEYVRKHGYATRARFGCSTGALLTSSLAASAVHHTTTSPPAVFANNPLHAEGWIMASDCGSVVLNSLLAPS